MEKKIKVEARQETRSRIQNLPDALLANVLGFLQVTELLMNMPRVASTFSNTLVMLAASNGQAVQIDCKLSAALFLNDDRMDKLARKARKVRFENCREAAARWLDDRRHEWELNDSQTARESLAIIESPQPATPDDKRHLCGTLRTVCEIGATNILLDDACTPLCLSAQDIRWALSDVRLNPSVRRIEVRHVDAKQRQELAGWLSSVAEIAWQDDDTTMIVTPGQVRGKKRKFDKQQQWPFRFLEREQYQWQKRPLPPAIQDWLTNGDPLQVDLQRSRQWVIAGLEKKWSPKSSERIKWYTGTGFEDVWKVLEGQIAGDRYTYTRTQVREFLDLLRPASGEGASYVPAGMVLFEGQGKYEKDWLGREWKVGERLTRKRVTSTTWHPIVAIGGFTHAATPKRVGDGIEQLVLVYRIVRDNDVPAIVIQTGHLGMLTHEEHEVLLGPNLEFTVTRIEPRRFFDLYEERGGRWTKSDYFKQPIAFRVVYLDCSTIKP